MNRFRKLGFIDYKGRIRVHKSLLNVILHDQLPEHNAMRPAILNAPVTRRTRNTNGIESGARKRAPAGASA
jgi:hypothetical protein